MKHIILIGFKHVGKSAVGKRLAETFEKEFIDLDEVIESLHEKRHGTKLSCREIVLEHGEQFFRELEHEALKLVMENNSSLVIGLGGGTPIDPRNQELIQGNIIVHVTADRGNVFEKIMIHGRPAIFPEGEELLPVFRRMWDEREKIYTMLAESSIDNNGSLDEAVEKLAKSIIIE